jgi:P27 family predicted phage terminase small subunit
MLRKKIQPPEHLLEQGRGCWEQITLNYSLEDHHLRLLQKACEMLDRGAEAKTTLLKQGTYIVDKRTQNLIPHPAVKVERDSAIAFTRILRELGLDAERGPRR